MATSDCTKITFWVLGRFGCSFFLLQPFLTLLLLLLSFTFLAHFVFFLFFSSILSSFSSSFFSSFFTFVVLLFLYPSKFKIQNSKFKIQNFKLSLNGIHLQNLPSQTLCLLPSSTGNLVFSAHWECDCTHT